MVANLGGRGQFVNVFIEISQGTLIEECMPGDELFAYKMLVNGCVKSQSTQPPSLSLARGLLPLSVYPLYRGAAEWCCGGWRTCER